MVRAPTRTMSVNLFGLSQRAIICLDLFIFLERHCNATSMMQRVGNMGKVREIWAPQNGAIFTIWYAYITLLGMLILPPMICPYYPSTAHK